LPNINLFSPEFEEAAQKPHLNVPQVVRKGTKIKSTKICHIQKDFKAKNRNALRGNGVLLSDAYSS